MMFLNRKRPDPIGKLNQIRLSSRRETLYRAGLVIPVMTNEIVRLAQVLFANSEIADQGLGLAEEEG
ncbi:MAG: hypothetical protein BVN35_04805 [Proteobacteria bacterium ST_bin11]|jgi:hypothetical protein|nr:MAG: hypothetical protein BVN35_04805 [Proteobacteria bacterium ST_bin11]